VLRWARKAWGPTLFPWIQRAIAVSEPAARYASAALEPRAIGDSQRGADRHLHPAGRSITTTRTSSCCSSDGSATLARAHATCSRRTRAGSRAKIAGHPRRGRRARPVRSAARQQLPGLNLPWRCRVRPAVVDVSRVRRVRRAIDRPGIVRDRAARGDGVGKASGVQRYRGHRQVATTEGSTLVPPADARALENALVRVVRTDPETRAPPRRAQSPPRRDLRLRSACRAVRHEYRLAIAACHAGAGRAVRGRGRGGSDRADQAVRSVRSEA